MLRIYKVLDSYNASNAQRESVEQMEQAKKGAAATIDY
jgi:hypothetical protein